MHGRGSTPWDGMYRRGGSKRASLAVTFARRRRLLLVAGLCVWVAIWARALQLQVFHGDQLAALAENQSDRSVRIVAPRGEIIDRHGRLLAINVAKRSFFAYPDSETSVTTLARQFAPVRGETFHALATAWTPRSKKFTWMVHRATEESAALVESWRLPGVYSMWEYERVYPTALDSVGGPVGFVDDSLSGEAGVESYYNEDLTGDDGEGEFVADAGGQRFVLNPVAGHPPMPGARLDLGLDARWQSILAEELKAAVTKWQALSGMAVIMDPYTGAIIAMADVDPARPAGLPIVKNRLVTDVFEPGSTFKVVSYAAGLSDGVVKPGQYFDGGNGAGTFSGRTIKDDKRHGVITVAEAFMVSSNVITGKVANRLDPGRLDFWARRLGFGQKTGIDLPAESDGRIAIEQHSEFNVATRSIGHGVAVTAMQLACAYAAVANGGYLVKPHVACAIEFSDGTARPIPTEGHRVLRPEVACLLADFMRGVVSEGTARTICDSLFPIAGKTGTAEKPNLRTGCYDKNKFMASFVGFYPATNPRLLGLVILDQPEPIHYGGYTSAPVLLNTIRRATALDDGPDAGRVRVFAATDSDAANVPDWSRRLVEAVGPLIAPAGPSTEPAPASQLVVRTGVPPRAPGVGPTAWERLLARRATRVWETATGGSVRDSLVAARDPEGALSEPGVVVAQRAAADSNAVGGQGRRWPAP